MIKTDNWATKNSTSTEQNIRSSISEAVKEFDHFSKGSQDEVVSYMSRKYQVAISREGSWYDWISETAYYCIGCGTTGKAAMKEYVNLLHNKIVTDVTKLIEEQNSAADSGKVSKTSVILFLSTIESKIKKATESAKCFTNFDSEEEDPDFKEVVSSLSNLSKTINEKSQELKV